LREKVPGGARFVYVFGSALVFLLFAQLCSGLALAFSYSPSTAAAWASVAHIEQTPFGHVLRGLHAQGATFLLLIASAHLLQTAIFGAYRAKRAATWWLGLFLLLLLLAFCLTGSLLPWDERGYWATRVTVGIAGSAPVFGAGLSRLLTGGPQFGNLTLSRFYTLHASLLPLLLLGAGTLHVALMRRHGVTPPPRFDEAKSEPFWPRQALYDALFGLALLVLLSLVAKARGAPLQGPADPGGAANPRPEWYFRPLFELLKHAPGGFELAAAFGIPLLVAGFLFLLPLFDTTARSHKVVLGILAAGLLTTFGLGVASYSADASDPQFARAEAMARLRAQKALKLSRGGVPPDGALALLQNQPEERGARTFARACTECHLGGLKAPALDGYLSKQWIHTVLRDPQAIYGTSKVSGMEDYRQLGEERLSALTDYLYALRSHAADDPALESGRRLYMSSGCGDCHSLVKGKDAGGPTLAGYGSAEWLRGLLRDPGTNAYYDAQNRMPDFGTRLAPADIDDLVEWLSSREAEQAELAGLESRNLE
jgi:ubiquinol-cytochrome c reductase cytochrome b subunit